MVRRQWCSVLGKNVNQRYLLPVLLRDCTPNQVVKYLVLHALAEKHGAKLECTPGKETVKT